MYAKAEEILREEYNNRLQKVYRDNLSELVPRTRKDIDGNIDKITVQLLENKPMMEQVESNLNAII